MSERLDDRSDRQARDAHVGAQPRDPVVRDPVDRDPVDRDPVESPVPGLSRLPGVVISIACVAAVCALATWPRFHPAVATVQLQGSDASPAATDVAQPDAGHAGMVPAPVPATSNAQSSPASPASSAAASPATMANATTPASDGAPSKAAAAAPSGPTTPGGTAAPAAVKREPPRRPTLVRVPVSDDVPATWKAMTPQQQDALQPFAELWPTLSDLQKRKWIAIASVYPRMSPDAQQRLHARMLRWAQMSPEQRRLARENYEMSRVLPPGARQQAWRAYEALPPAQRAKFAADERKRQPLVVSAPPSEPHHAPRRSARRGVPASSPTVGAGAGASAGKAGAARPDGTAMPGAAADTPAASAAAAQAPAMPEPSVGQH